MVEAITEKLDGINLEGDLPEINLEDFKKVFVDSKYLDSAEEEIEQALINAKVSLCQLGFDLDKERLARDEEEKDYEKVDNTEMERLLAGGLPFCRKEKECGHYCGGVKNEEECLPCLQPECIEGTKLPSKKELCNICYTCELHEEPSVLLKCGHVFHVNCVVELLKHKWTTLRITFAFMNCPLCNKPIEADHVYEIADEIE